jgi:ribosomal protein S18 acetylase RimI-like enzyme
MNSYTIRPIVTEDRILIKSLLDKHWGSTWIITKGVIHQADQLPGFVAIKENQLLGLVTYTIENKLCEIVTLNSLQEDIGIGSALINKVTDCARDAECTKLSLITTNDNVKALGFYQKRGFVIAAVYLNAIEGSRRLKPEIPFTGCDGIPIRDEIELIMIL